MADILKTISVLLQNHGKAGNKRRVTLILLLHGPAEANEGDGAAAVPAAEAMQRVLWDPQPPKISHNERVVRADSIRAVCMACRTAPSFDSPYPAFGLQRAEDSACRAMMRKQATRQALFAAAPLLEKLKSAPGGPVLLPGLAELCRALLPRKQGGPPEGPQMNRLTHALAGETLAAQAFLASHQLVQVPEATLPAPFAGAHMSYGNGPRRDGLGSALDEAKKRLLKLGDYAWQAARKQKTTQFEGKGRAGR